MEPEIKITAPLEHPCYAGHFPGNPVVPGVLLLDLVMVALERGAPRLLGNVKFHRAVRPGETFTLRHTTTGARLAFRCVDGDQLLFEGSVSFRTAAGDNA
jgi:3-hydroxymyristoyl/3-hydroxydecanoyl-(acyl carrier protein) dehydratase